MRDLEFEDVQQLPAGAINDRVSRCRPRHQHARPHNSASTALMVFPQDTPPIIIKQVTGRKFLARYQFGIAALGTNPVVVQAAPNLGGIAPSNAAICFKFGRQIQWIP